MSFSNEIPRQKPEEITLKNQEKDEGIINKLDLLIAKFSKKHDFNFKFLENDDILKENKSPNVKVPISDPEDVISQIKHKQKLDFLL